MFGRKEVSRTHRQQLLDELVESYNHLKLAAAHAAEGTAERMTPTYDKARHAAARGWSTTRTTVVQPPPQMKHAAGKARQKRSRWPRFFGLLAAGAAVGAAGAVVSRRRRNAAQWEEYEPMPGLETGVGTEGGAREKAASAAGKVAAGAAAMAEGVSTRAGRMAESVRGTGGETVSGKGPDIGDTAMEADEARRMQAGGAGPAATDRIEDTARSETFSAFAEEGRDDLGRP